MMSRITINLKRTGNKKQDIDVDLAAKPSLANVVVEHACSQVASVLSITRSVLQEDRGTGADSDSGGIDLAELGEIESGWAKCDSMSSI